MPVTARTLSEMRRMRLQLDTTVDAATRDLARTWETAWAEIAAEWAYALDDLIRSSDHGWPTRAQISRASRAQQALAHSGDRLDQLGREAGVRILRDVSALVEDAAGWLERIIRTQLPPGTMVTWDRVDTAAIDAIVQRTTGRVEALTMPIADDAQQAMRSSLIRGVATGDNPRHAAAEMLSRLGRDFDGGRWRAENIARTELADAHRAAARAARAANTDVVSGWRWMCSLSARTCPACLAKHGTWHEATDPGPYGHPSCRCTAVPVTRSWRDLGHDIDEPDGQFPDARRWFDDQPDDVQRRIMGPARLDALRAGRLEWDDMAVLHDNPGWRPSWAIAPVPAA